MAQAVRAMRKCYGSGTMRKDTCVKPSGVWTIPELAWAGITEDKAKADGLNFGTVTVDFDRTARGCVTRQEGFLKLIYNAESGKVLGVHMCGENSCDLINFGAEAICNGDTIYDMLHFVFPAVTYHMLYNYAAWEAKLRIMHGGARNLEAAIAWQRVETALQESCEEQGKNIQEILHSTFRYFDKDASGFVTAEDLKEAVRGLGMDVSDEQAMEMVIEATGSAADHEIEYEDFLRIFSVGASAQVLTSARGGASY